MKIFSRSIIALAVLSAVACTQVKTGEVGLRQDFSGNINPTPLGTGWHQHIVGDVLVFSSKEVLVPITGLQPNTADKIPMEDIDMQFTYRVNEASIPKLYVKYNHSYNANDGGEIYPLYTFITQLVRSSVGLTISKYPALKVNDSLPEIAATIKGDVEEKIKAEGLEHDVTVGQINLTKISIPRTMVESTQAVVTAQNNAKAAEYAAKQAVITAQGVADSSVIEARGKAQAISLQAQTIAVSGGDAYLHLKAIEKWDGSMPTYLSNGAPLPFIGNATTAKVTQKE